MVCWKRRDSSGRAVNSLVCGEAYIDAVPFLTIPYSIELKLLPHNKMSYLNDIAAQISVGLHHSPKINLDLAY